MAKTAAEAPRILPEEVKERLDRGERLVFVDARSPQAWAAAIDKVPGAIRIDPDRLDPQAAELPRTRAVIVVYCTSPGETDSARVALRLGELGRGAVYALLGGFDAWRDAGYAIEAIPAGPVHVPTP